MTYRGPPMSRFQTIAAALRSLGGQARPAQIAAEIRRLFPGPHPRTLLNSVRGRLQEHSSDSKLYRGRSDLFYSVHGIGGGLWGLREMETSAANQADTLDEEITRDAQQYLESTIRRLENGAQPRYGSPSELRERQKLLAEIAQLKEELERLRPHHGGIGHNQPPPDQRETIANSGIVEWAVEKAEIIEIQIAKETPDALEIARSAHWLQQFTHWLAGKADTFADEFARAFGRSLGKSAGVAVAAGGLILALHGVLRSAGDWLQLVLQVS